MSLKQIGNKSEWEVSWEQPIHIYEAAKFLDINAKFVSEMVDLGMLRRKKCIGKNPKYGYNLYILDFEDVADYSTCFILGGKLIHRIAIVRMNKALKDEAKVKYCLENKILEPEQIEQKKQEIEKENLFPWEE